MENLIGLTILWLLWLIFPHRRRQRCRKGWILGVVVLLLVSPMGVAIGSWGLTVFLPPDSGEAVDAIVVLGRGDEMRDRRIVETWNLWRANRAPQIFASGMSDARPIVRELKATGIPKQRLSGEECSQTTEENALFTAALVHPQGVKHILLVTDSPHMLRSLRTFQSVGFSTIPYPISLSDQLQTAKKIQILFREYVALLQYAVSGRFQSRLSSASMELPTTVTRKLQDWRCRVTGDE